MNQIEIRNKFFGQNVVNTYVNECTLKATEVQERLDVCFRCKSFTGNGCLILGCCPSGRDDLLHRLVRHRGKCPDTPSKWS